MQRLIKPGKYEHYKGQLYEVLDTVRHSEDESVLVLYRQLYGDKSLWVRPYKMFIEQVETKEGLTERFRFLSSEV